MNKKRTVILEKYIFPVLLFLLPLWNIWSGVDLADTGYSLSYYKFFTELDGMWFFSTYLSNLAGWLMHFLPGGDTLLGMNFYTSLLFSISVPVFYFVLSRKVKPYLVFFGEAVALFLCWCPAAILYHNLTYLFFSLGTLLLLYGLWNDKRKFLFCAGIVLGINAFVRTPSNFLEVLMILAVWYAGWLNRKKFREILKDTAVCIAGYFVSLTVILTAVGSVYGWSTYFEAVFQMLGSTENASDYTFMSMLVTVFKNLLEGLYWMAGLAVLWGAGILIQLIAGKKKITVKNICCVLVGLAGIYLMMRKGFFDRNYYYHLAVYRPFLIFVWLTLLAGVWCLWSEHAQKWEKIWAVSVLLITVIMPFGTNNHFYANMNNLFLTAPFTLYAFAQLLRLAADKKNAVLLSAAGILIAYFLVFGIQCAGYGMNFVLYDGYEQEKRNTEVKGIPTLEGMYTVREKAEELTHLNEYLDGEGYGQSELITYGGYPGLYYYLDMPCATSVLWPDLNTSSGKVFSGELREITEEIKEGRSAPVVILSADVSGRWKKAEIRGEKEKILKEFLQKNEYTENYESGLFSVYVP